GGNIVDMVRFDRILEIIEEDGLVENAKETGGYLLEQIEAMAERHPAVTNPRGQGLMCAFDLATPAIRDLVRKEAFERGLVILGCGERAIRFRPALTIDRAGLDRGLAILESALDEVVG